MNKVIVVSKTHLDLGFTDYAENIKNKYLNDFIPSAVEIAKEVNKDCKNKKHFVWTTGSWLLCESLKLMTDVNKQKLIDALKRGDIAPHAMPFTTHTELLDEDTIDYGLTLVDTIDAIVGRKTISAKMTDVPGHSISIVPLLAKHGIKLLHIGVNGASTLPSVPECFLWKYENSEVVVIYSGDYGGEYKCQYTGDILYFDHTLDNHGTPNAEKVEKKYQQIAQKYPNYEVVAGRMDDFAENLWQVKDKLPIIDCEIGDTWIHGVATDSFKVGAFKELVALKKKWLESGSLQKASQEYNDFCDNLLCVAEHTWGCDVKIFFCDYNHYTRKSFDKARKRDKVRINPFLKPSCNIQNYFGKKIGILKWDRYTTIEKSWKEQRSYIFKAIGALSAERQAEANEVVQQLIPNKIVKISECCSANNCDNNGNKSNLPMQNNCDNNGNKSNLPMQNNCDIKACSTNLLSQDDSNNKNITQLEINKNYNNKNITQLEINKNYSVNKWTLSINANGGIGKLLYGDAVIINSNAGDIVQYHSYGSSDYAYWLSHYTRNLEKNKHWAIADFAKPNLSSVEGKYPEGLFGASFVNGIVEKTMIESSGVAKTTEKIKVVVDLTFDEKLFLQAGAPKNIQIIYLLSDSGLKIEMLWSEKPANRLPESVLFRLFPKIDDNCNLTYFKIGKAINPLDVVSKGNRKISAVEKINFNVENMTFEIINNHSPLVELGEDNILKFDDSFGDMKNQGISYILQNNIWGTNFPLWYGDNAMFSFEICKKK